MSSARHSLLTLARHCCHAERRHSRATCPIGGVTTSASCHERRRREPGESPRPFPSRSQRLGRAGHVQRDGCGRRRLPPGRGGGSLVLQRQRREAARGSRQARDAPRERGSRPGEDSRSGRGDPDPVRQVASSGKTPRHLSADGTAPLGFNRSLCATPNSGCHKADKTADGRRPSRAQSVSPHRQLKPGTIWNGRDLHPDGGAHRGVTQIARRATPEPGECQT
ncbi:unnamed protein product [Lampetra fluviatilis]